jgi:hypothetical protein
MDMKTDPFEKLMLMRLAKKWPYFTEPEVSLLRLYEPQLDPALSQSSSLPQILSLTTAS